MKAAASPVAAGALAGGPPTVTSPVPRDVWESLYRGDPAAVVSQSLPWRDALASTGSCTDASLLYEFPSGTQVVLPMARRRHLPAWAGTAGSWSGAWGVGGPLSLGGRVSPAEAAAVLADARRRAPLGVEIEFRHGAADVWLREAHGYRTEREGCHVLDLAGGFDQVWQHKFAGTARTAARKAEKSGVEVEVDRAGRLIPVFLDLYEKSIQRWAARQHEPLWLARWRTARATTPRMLTALASHFGEDFGIWVAKSEGVPVASVIIVKAGGYAKYMRGAMDSERANRLRANDLLHRMAIEDACADGRRWYDMGHTRPGSSLASFKEKLGADLSYNHQLRAERVPVGAAATVARNGIKRAIRFRDV